MQYQCDAIREESGVRVTSALRCQVNKLDIESVTSAILQRRDIR